MSAMSSTGKRMHDLVERLGAAEALERLANPVASAARPLVAPPAVKNALSGTWLGHRLHPVLTDATLGALLSASLLDLVGGRDGARAADRLMWLGLASALPTAAAGLSDWTDAYGKPRRVGLVHALANTVASTLYAGSLLARRRGRRVRGVALGLAGLGVLGVGAYLGGHLSYTYGFGVDHTAFDPELAEWRPTIAASDLQVGQPQAVTVGDLELLLSRLPDGGITALSNHCSHAGCPLSEGKFEPDRVQCGCHGSVFRLADGEVLRGPAASPQRRYQVRVVDGIIQVSGG